MDSGEIANYWGNGYFLVLKFEDQDGVEPENITVAGTPLDSDMLGVWMIGKFDENDQLKKGKSLPVVVTTDEYTRTQNYDLTGLTFEPKE